MPRLVLLSSDAPPDDDHIKALAHRDRRAATDALVRRYRDPLFHHAAAILRDWEEAIDVAQEVFIKALREPRFFDDDFKMKAWLYRVASNLCFNLVRDRRRRGAILGAQPPADPEHAAQAEVVFQTEQQAAIAAALDRLTEDHREILTLRYYGDLSYAEIAQALDLKLGTVMSRLSRAKEALTESLVRSGVEVD